MIEQRAETRYDRRAFAQAYVDAHPNSEAAYHMGYESYTAAMKVYYQQLLAGLQDLFELTLDQASLSGEHLAFSMLLETTAKSYFTTVRPFAQWADATLLYRKLDEAGQLEGFTSAVERIGELKTEAAAAHLDIMAGLLEAMLGDRADRVFTSADLRAIGIDDQPPRISDYSDDAWENY